LEHLPKARWAESLREALPRALAAHLQSSDGVDVIGFYPWSLPSAPATKVYVRFERFSANAAGRVEVVARWDIQREGEALRSGRFVAADLRWQSGEGGAAYVTALDAGLAQLSAQIGEAYATSTDR
jgi:uncharacterized lipoprotein YmbA